MVREQVGRQRLHTVSPDGRQDSLCAITSVGVALAEEAAEKCLVASSAATSVPAVACKGKEGKGGRERGWSGLATTVRKVLSL